MSKERIEGLDFARGVALIAMAIFHFAFDLQLLGLKEPGFIEQAHWKYFARSIASSFLFLTGFSLYLAHSNGIRWQSWRGRFVKIIVAALLITVATYFVTPDQYIFFGILHSIAFASLLGLLFLNIPWLITAVIGVGVFLLGNFGQTEIMNGWIWFWTGLSETRPTSSDYVPVFPWMAAPLLGIAFAKIAEQRNWLEIMAKPKFQSSPSRALKFIGRHSLVFYLLHQPIILGFLLAVSWAMGWIALN